MQKKKEGPGSANSLKTRLEKEFFIDCGMGLSGWPKGCGIVFFVLFSACSDHHGEPAPAPVREPEIVMPSVPDDTVPLERKLLAAGLVNIQSVDPRIRVDLKYASRDNFMHADVYGGLRRAYLQPEVASMLKKAEDLLAQKDSNLTLLVWDAARPQSVQQLMWDTLQMPFDEKIRFLSNPKNASVHNYGAAVDVSISGPDGPLDMGTSFDFFGKAAEPRFEQACLQDGSLSRAQLENRLLLRSVMRGAGFRQLDTEWWHYNAFSRADVKSKYALIK